jgi:hypothetical protein
MKAKMDLADKIFVIGWFIGGTKVVEGMLQVCQNSRFRFPVSSFQF